MHSIVSSIHSICYSTLARGSMTRHILSDFKALSNPVAKLNFIQHFVKRNLEISKINSILHTIMTISKHDIAYRIFMIYLSSGRKLNGTDSSCFDYIIKILVQNERMDEAERVILAMEKFNVVCPKDNYIRLFKGYARSLNKKYLARKELKIDVLLQIFEKIRRNSTLNVGMYNTLFKVFANRGLIGVLVEYYGEMLQNGILPNAETCLYFALAISKRMEGENIIQAYLPLISHYPDPKSIIKVVNDMLLRRLSYKYLYKDDENYLQRTRRNFGAQELVSNVLKDVIRKMDTDNENENENDLLCRIGNATPRFLFNWKNNSDFMGNFDQKELRRKAYGLLIIELSEKNLVSLVKEKLNEMIHDGITPTVEVYTAVISMLGSMNDLEGVNYYLQDMRQRNVNPNSATYHVFLSILSRKNADTSQLSELESGDIESTASVRALRADLAKSRTEVQKIISSITFESQLKPSQYIYHSLIKNLIKLTRLPFSSLRFDRLNLLYGRPKEYDVESDVPFSVEIDDGITFELKDNFEKIHENTDLEKKASHSLSSRRSSGFVPSDSTMWLAKKVFDDMINSGLTPFEATFRIMFLGYISRNEMKQGVDLYLTMWSQFDMLPSLAFRLEVYKILIAKGNYKLLAEVLKAILSKDSRGADWIYIRYIIFQSALLKESDWADISAKHIMNIHRALVACGRKIDYSFILDALYIFGFVDQNDSAFDSLWKWALDNDLVNSDGMLYFIEKLLLSGKTDEIIQICTSEIFVRNSSLGNEALEDILAFLDKNGFGLIAGAIRMFWGNNMGNISQE